MTISDNDNSNLKPKEMDVKLVSNYSFEDLRDKIRKEIKAKYNDGLNKTDFWPIRVEPDPPITKGNTVIENYTDGKYYNLPFSVNDKNEIELGEEVEVERQESFVAVKSRVIAVEKAKDHVIFTGTVLIPGEPDCDFENGEEPLSKSKVAKMAHEFLANYRIVDKDHNYFETGQEVGVPVESWIFDEPKILKSIDGVERTYPEGTWAVKSKITDPDLMEAAEKGDVAYSVTGLDKAVADKIIASIKSRVLIKDLKDPVGFTVSLVKNPCVDNSCSAKSKAAIKSKEDKSVVEKARDLLNEMLNGGVDMGEKEKKTEFVTKSDLDERFDSLKTELLAEKADKCKCGATPGADDKFCAACGTKVGAPAKKSDEEEEDSEKKSEKSEKKKEHDNSKALKNHDPDNGEVAFKSVESYMGRDAKGRPIKKQ